MICAQRSRGSLVMELASLTERMMGVLICQQVVSVNDGQAGSLVECSSGWVGCGMTVVAPPTTHHPAQPVHHKWMSLGLPEIVELLSYCLRKEEAENLAWIPYLHQLLPGSLLLLPPLHLDMWEGNDRMIRGVSEGVDFFSWRTI